MYTINTKTQLMAFLLFALVVNGLHFNALALLMLGLFMVLVFLKNRHFFRLMCSLKWFYLVMFIIFLFNTPGEHIANWPLVLKPTYEGLYLGVEQVLRIAVMLAAVSIVLTENTKQQLISGLYFLIHPLSYIGIDTKRFSARLWLTLHYVEQQDMKSERVRLKDGLGHYLSNIFIDEKHDDVVIELETPAETWGDFFVLIVMALILGVIVFDWVI